MNNIYDDLISSLLHDQTDDGRGWDIPDTDLVAIAGGQRAPSAEERDILATSPMARYRLAECVEDIRQEEAYRQEKLAAWRNTYVPQTGRLPLAAASKTEDWPTIAIGNWILTLVPPASDDSTWTLILTPPAHRPPVHCIVRMVDAEGMVWMTGELSDDVEELVTEWTLGGSPEDRLVGIDLKLDFS